MTVIDAAHSGDEALVFGIDLGTTMSAVSYCHMQPGVVPSVRLVTKWPGQEDAAGDCKIPTVVRYRVQPGTAPFPVSFGARAVENPEALDDTVLARWFKLHLHPAATRAAGALNDVPPLPQGISLKKIYADFVSYLFLHATDFFRNTSHDGDSLWRRFKDKYDIVLAVPNGWDMAQQTFLRDVLVLADVLPADHEKSRLTFVSEAEASVHYALEHAQGNRWLSVGTNFAVLDAGGSTVDTTVYRCAAVHPKLLLEEVTSSECVQAGAVFVDRDAEKMLRLRLKGSKFEHDEFIGEMIQIFERKTKRKFDGGPEASVIHFGRASDNDPQHSISKGRITLTSDEVSFAFQGVIVDILASTDRVIARSQKVCDALLMVGGFSESPYLRKILREKYSNQGIQFVSVDDGTKKAAAEGATIWYLRRNVVARAARAWFGTKTLSEYKGEPWHQERAGTEFTQVNGRILIGPVFSVWCNKNEVNGEGESRTFEYQQSYKSRPSRHDLSTYYIEVYAFDPDERPKWVFKPNLSKINANLVGGTRHICRIAADLGGLEDTLQEHRAPNGTIYWKIEFGVNVFFGQTALSAQLTWREKGETKTGELKLLPNSIY